MRIAQVAPLYESVPPKYYGGTERVVSHLTEELVRQGHQVTLFASGDSVVFRGLARYSAGTESSPHYSVCGLIRLLRAASWRIWQLPRPTRTARSRMQSLAQGAARDARG
jgi:glycosyl transferase family 4